MKIVVMAQEEPVHMGPFLIRVLERRREQILAVAVGRTRGIGGSPRTFRERWERLRVYWLLLEPWGFFRSLAVGICWRLLRALGPLGRPFDRRSLDRAASRLGIPVLRFTDPNDPAFLESLRGLDPDILFNQSECMIGPELLALPRRGVVNRHGSLLPRHRGRLASFWTHADGEGSFSITVHFVDHGIDSGPIILQRSFAIDPCAPYADVLSRVFDASADAVLDAFDRMQAPDFAPRPNDVERGSIHKLPTVAEALSYRRTLAERRNSRK